MAPRLLTSSLQDVKPLGGELTKDLKPVSVTFDESRSIHLQGMARIRCIPSHGGFAASSLRWSLAWRREHPNTPVDQLLLIRNQLLGEAVL